MLASSSTLLADGDGVITSDSSNLTVQVATTFYLGWDNVFGSGDSDRYFNGNIDEVRIYNRALSSNEVAQLYSLESTPPTPQISSDLTNVTAVVGGDATFAVEASGAGPLTYQWSYTNSNPLAVAGGYPLSIAGFVYGVTITNGGFGYGSAPKVNFIGGGGNGALGYSTVSNGAVISVTITSAGSGYSSLPIVVIDPPSGPLAGQTNSTLTIANVGPSNLGSYWVVVSNGSGSITSSVANITLLYPPSIAVSPASQSLALHGLTTLSVTAAGTPPLSYQWTLAGTNLPSAATSALVLTNFSVAQVGSYAVRVSSPYGTVTSSAAQVSMLPSLNVPFVGGVNLWGQPATLTVGAVGTGDLLYQWYFNGQTIAGATSNSYTIPTIQFTNAGLYSVVVSSSLGSVTNTPYQVVVNPANISLGLYPGVRVSGTIGYTYTIEGSTDLSDTNAWVPLGNLTLTQPVQIWIDYTADTTQPQNPRKFYRVVAAQVEVSAGMVLIPAGAFTMGDTLDGANPPPISVTVSAFYMDTNLVSKTQWDEVYTWAIAHGYTFDNPGSFRAANHPVQSVSWYDVVKWCNARSEQEGGDAAYYTDEGLGTVYRSGRVSPTVKWNSKGYRLPTEAEWEKAARGGVSGQRFPWGNTISRSQANYQGNTSSYSYDLGPDGYNPAYTGGGYPYTSPVGSYAPNGYGLNDMAGNVLQWCWDWFGTPYAGGSDPHGPVGPLSGRVLRGSAWLGNANWTRCANRNISNPVNADLTIGFRCVRGL